MTRTRRKPAWYEHFPTRIRFDGDARAVYPRLRAKRVGRGEVAYEVKVSVPEYEDRTIEMVFLSTTSEPRLLQVYADGPTGSRHRYGPREKDRRHRSSLCIWHPDDPPQHRWVPEDGLLSLIEAARVHLFKEAYARETADWPGDEAPHSSASKS
jgi:hypothetical protein